MRGFGRHVLELILMDVDASKVRSKCVEFQSLHQK